MALTKLTQSLIDGTLVTSVNGNTGAVTTGIDLQSSVKTANFTAVANEGYLVNTTSSAITVTLPSSPSLGDEVLIIDYAGTFGTNNATLTSSDNILGSSSNYVIESNNVSVILIYTDATKGWKVKTAANEGTTAISLPPVDIDYLVVGGGGSGGIIGSAASAGAGAGGAGGLRTSYGSTSGGGTSAESSLSFARGQVYTITVGAGGASTTAQVQASGNQGNNSSIAGSGITTITSIGGGGGGGNSSPYVATSGGSGGGGEESDGIGGSGTAGQGYDGGDGSESGNFGGGGGGAASAGSGLTGGSSLAVSITGTSVNYSSGGNSNNSGSDSITNAAANSGNGAYAGGTINVNGGSGVVILRMNTSDYSGTTTGSPTVTTDGLYTVIKFTQSGTYTA